MQKPIVHRQTILVFCTFIVLLMAIAAIAALVLTALGIPIPSAHGQTISAGPYQIKTFYSPAVSSAANRATLQREINEWFFQNPGVRFVALSQNHGVFENKMLTLTYRKGVGENPYFVELFYCGDISSSTMRPQFEREVNDWLAQNAEAYIANIAEAQDGNGHVLKVYIYQK